MIIVTFEPGTTEEMSILEHPKYGKIPLYNGIFVKTNGGLYVPVFTMYDFDNYEILKNAIRTFNTKFKKKILKIELTELNIRDILIAKLLTTSDNKIDIDVSYNKSLMLRSLNFLLKYMGISKKELSSKKLEIIMKVQPSYAVKINITHIPISVIITDSVFIISYEQNVETIKKVYMIVSKALNTWGNITSMFESFLSELTSPETVIMFANQIHIYHNIVNVIRHYIAIYIDNMGRLKPFYHNIILSNGSQRLSEKYLYSGNFVNMKTISFQDISLVLYAPQSIDILDVPSKQLITLRGQNAEITYLSKVKLKGEPYRGIKAFLTERISSNRININITLV